MGQFADKVNSFRVASLAKAEAIRKDIIFDLFSRIVYDSAVDTGNFAANWNTAQGAPDLSFSPWGNGRRNNDDSQRYLFKQSSFALAVSGIMANLGNGLGRDTKTFFSNSSAGKDGDAYGWKIEYGYGFYAWDAQTGMPPPSENVLSDGHSRHAPKGMVRINVARWDEIVRRSVQKHK